MRLMSGEIRVCNKGQAIEAAPVGASWSGCASPVTRKAAVWPEIGGESLSRVCGFPQPYMVTGRMRVRGAPNTRTGRLAFFENRIWRILAVEDVRA